MNIAGERIIVFGDSLSHAGADAGPTIVDVNASQRYASSSPGEWLARNLLAAGAQAVRINARVGRSARSFLFNEDASSLLASDRQFAPTKVIVWLGTNDIDRGVTPTALAQTQTALAQIRDAYRQMGAEVFALGPPAYQNAHYTAGAPAMLAVMRGVFGADHTFDTTAATAGAARSRDGVHFTGSSAPVVGSTLAKLVANALVPTTSSTPTSTSRLSTKQKVGIAVGAIGLSVIGVLVFRRLRRSSQFGADDVVVPDDRVPTSDELYAVAADLVREYTDLKKHRKEKSPEARQLLQQLKTIRKEIKTHYPDATPPEAYTKLVAKANKATKTYAQAQAEIYQDLAAHGWDVHKDLQIPYATSPNGRVRLWFKPQAVWYTLTDLNDRHSFRNAHSISYTLDIRKFHGDEFRKAVEKSFEKRLAD